MSYADATFIVDFIKNLAQRQGLQQPVPEHAASLPVTLLPAGCTKKQVHKMYKEVLTNMLCADWLKL